MNQLTRIDEFREVLANYRPSDESLHGLKDLKLAFLVGPSSSGKNTIINQLVKEDSYCPIVSDTTRQPRANNGVMEENGREYWFRSEVDILADLREGKFLEASIIHNQQVSGVSIRELRAAADHDKIAIDEIEVVGADNVHALMPSAQFLFVIPPSFDEWVTRMNARGTLPADETKRRVESAVEEITRALNRDYYTFVVNDTYMQTTKQVDDIIRHRTVEGKSQAEARELARRLLVDTKHFLADLEA